MTAIKDQTLTGQHFVDGQHYINIQFRDATLTYGGGTPPTFENCIFDGATFSFEGPARATLLFLNAMAPATTNMREIVLGLLPALND